MNNYRPGGFGMLPPVVKNLLIINILFFVASLSLRYSMHLDLAEYLGLHFIKSPGFKPFQYVTYMFLHADIGHIFFNMFALWMFGKVIETVWGPKKFLTYYFVTGVGAAVIQTIVTWWGYHNMMTDLATLNNTPTPGLLMNFIKDYIPNPNPQLYDFINEWSANVSNIEYINTAKGIANKVVDYTMTNSITIGASGAVFGLLLAFGMMFPNAVLYIYFAIPMKAKYFVILYGALELMFGVMNGSGDNVAHFAHLGGMLFGFILIKMWNKNKYNSQF